jgi:hypothetical protein
MTKVLKEGEEEQGEGVLVVAAVVTIITIREIVVVVGGDSIAAEV